MLARGTSVFNAHRSKDINVWWHVAHGGIGMDKEKIDKTDATLAVDDLYDSHQDNSEEDDDKENGYIR